LLAADGTFPDWVNDVRAASPSSKPRIAPAGPSLVCTFEADALTVAAARMLARSTGREYRHIDLCASEVAEVVGDADAPARVCFVAPPLDRGDGIAPPEWLFTLIELMRDLWDRSEKKNRPGPEWGLVTAPDETSFAAAIARACFAQSIAEAFAPGGVCLSPRTGAPWDDPAAVDAGVAWASGFDDTNVSVLPSRGWGGETLQARVSARRDWFLLEGHGRTYCLNEGMVCAGRTLQESPDSDEFACLGVFSCATSRHLRVDPRQYQARVVVLDCCEPANPLGYAWKLGYDSSAFRFLAGAASAVISTDLLVVRSDRSIVDILLHAIFCDTLGETVSRLNLLRRQANPPMPYVLLGDPETPTFAAPPLPTATLNGADDRVPPEARAIEIARPSLAAASEYQCAFLGADGEVRPALRTSAVQTRGGARIVVMGEPAGKPRHVRLLSKKISTRAPPVRRGVLPKLRHDLRKPWKSFQLAAAEALAGPNASGAVVRLAEASVRTLAEVADQSIGRSWPQDLWEVSIETTTRHAACPVCGREGLVKRYRSGSARRFWRECLRCRITEDHPWDAQDCSARLLAPDVAGQTASEVKLLLASGKLASVGAACVFVDGTGHGLRVTPRFRVFVIEPGGDYEGLFEMRPDDIPAPAQMYYLRALLLISGQVHWLSRPVAVPRPPPPA
jgi:hypothetical protein